jgi:hypothetical protein
MKAAVAKIIIQKPGCRNLATIYNDMCKMDPRIFTIIFCFLPRMNRKRKKCKRTVCMKQG